MVKDKETGQFTDRPSQLIDHPDEQTVIDRIRQLRAEGNGLRKIAKQLEEAGIRCRGKRWHASTIASILKRGDRSTSSEPGLGIEAISFHPLHF
ncbi:MAG: recombinase family protein [Gemmataceae bacterium]